MTRKINVAGLALIKSYEGFVPFVYDDLRPVKGTNHGYREWDGSAPKGTLTIGYGHTNAASHPLKISQGLRVTEAEALEILAVDLDECEGRVSRAVKVPLNDNQFGALVSFDYNTGAITRASFVKRLNTGNYDAVPAGLALYVKAKGQTLRGLVRRRQAEADLWVKPAGATGTVPTPATSGRAATEIKRLQQSLSGLGYNPGWLDGIWGSRTRGALLAFKADADMPLTDTVDATVWEALARAPHREVSEARASITAKDLAQAGDKAVKAAIATKRISLGLGGLRVGSFLFGGIEHIKAASEYLAEPLALLGAVPSWVPPFLIGGVAVYLYMSAGKVERAKVEAVRSGLDAGVA
ncbi:glycoside hydrolase family protein [Castellaniella sp.]|uniref:glycoside hydrolase family protein n=1 Tax=Castellaniella sp. TaxID=1955812 RepID=UPI002AFE94C8|nr:glycoside hydrolase family protein [Castellaniella sp.]